MSRKSSSTILYATRSSWNVFASAILTMCTAGSVYWFPSLGHGLSTHLHFSESQVTAILTAVNAGSLFSFVGGLLYRRAGPMRTLIFGASLISLSYFGLGLLVRYQYANAFPSAVLLALGAGSSGHIVYSASMATSAAMFPKSLRGRVMGVLSAMYGMSGGVLGVLQSAFFPSVRDTQHLLFFVSVFTATPIIIAYFLFPDSTLPTIALGVPRSADTETERAPLLSTHGSNAVILTDLTVSTPGSDDRLIGVTYAIAFAVVVNLQFGAYASWTNASKIPLPQFLDSSLRNLGLAPILRPQLLCAFILVLLLGSFTLIPFGFRPANLPQYTNDDTSAEEEPNEPVGMPFEIVVRDFRFRLFFFAFFILPGCGSITTLIQATGVAASRIFPGVHNEFIPASVGTGDSIGSAVRALIVAFSACNMMARLIAGSISDIGGSARAREEWKLRLIQVDILLMCCATLGIALSSSWQLIISVGLVGFAHGAFYAITPTQVSNWFGVDGFPLYFGIFAIGIFISSVTVSSYVATMFADYVMGKNWVDVMTSASNPVPQRFCTGLLCYGPTFASVALLNFILLLAFLVQHNRILRLRSLSSYLPLAS